MDDSRMQPAVERPAPPKLHAWRPWLVLVVSLLLMHAFVYAVERRMSSFMALISDGPISGTTSAA